MSPQRSLILSSMILAVSVLGCGERPRGLPDAERARLADQLGVDIRGPVAEVRPALYRRLAPIDRGDFLASFYPQITILRPRWKCFLDMEHSLRNKYGHLLRLNACYRGGESGDSLWIRAAAVRVGDGKASPEIEYVVNNFWEQGRPERAPLGLWVEAADFQTSAFGLYKAVAATPDSIPVRIELIGENAKGHMP